MANILIYFANDKYRNSAWRLRQQAKKTRRFDKIIGYSERDLPPYIKASPLMFYGRGIGGFIWKPYVIWQTLQDCNEGDVVYYVDSGSSISESDEWDKFASILTDHNALFFQYRDDVDYGYAQRWPNASSRLKHWSSPAMLEYFKQYTGNAEAGEDNTLWAGFMILKKSAETMRLVSEWMYVFLFHPELIVDPYGREADQLPPYYNANRHDQSVISYLVMHYRDRMRLAVVPETSESQTTGAVRAERFIEGRTSWYKTLKFKLYYLLHHK